MAHMESLLKSKTYKLDDHLAVQEYFHAHHWTDGLPIVPPTSRSVEDLLAWSNLEPEHLIGIEPVRNRRITAEKLAVNSVMAGCLPDHFPAVSYTQLTLPTTPYV